MDSEIINIWRASGFVGIPKLKKILTEHNIKISASKLGEIIKEQKTAQLHKKVKRNDKAMGHIVAYAKNQNWQMDLSDMTVYANSNKGYKYILLAVDIFTRKAFAEPIKTKSANAILDAFAKMTVREYPDRVTTDNGSEFISKEFEGKLNNEGIEHNLVEVGNHHALGIIDRLTRTLKEMTHKHFTENNTINWVDNLQNMINTYNNNPHESLNDAKPKDVADGKHEEDILETNIKKAEETETIQTSIAVNDTVRVRLNKGTFGKGYTESFSRETYTVTKVNKTTVILNDGRKVRISDVQKVAPDTPSINTVDKVQVAKRNKKAKLDFDKEGLNTNTIVEGMSTRSTKRKR